MARHHHHLRRGEMHQRGIRDAIASAFANPFGLAGPAPAKPTSTTSTTAKAASTTAQPATSQKQQSPGSTTIVVYVTATPTFTGSVAGYSTMPGAPTQNSQTQDSDSSSPTSSSSTSSSDSSTSTSASDSSSSTSSSSTSSSSATPTASSSSSTDSIVVQSSTELPSTSVSAASSTASPSATAAQGSGLGTAAIAGLALGGLVLVGAVLALILICLKRKRRAAYLKADDEKSPFGPSSEFTPSDRAASVRTARTASTAPRLSLRPVTQFQPNLGNDQQQQNRPGNMTMTPASAVSPPENRYSWEQPMNTNDPANPFGNHAETGSQRSSPTSSITSATLPGSNEAPIELSPVFPSSSAPVASVAPVEMDSGSPVAPIVAAGAAVGAGAVAAAARSQRSNNNSQSPGRSTPSPTGSERSNAPSYANGPPPPPVHRVQLDFKPSMDDEIELRAGQLVRMLKEYDDGWALCVRMDRSQQGVAPRSCLSPRSVKPRPNNAPPSNINSRAPPQGMRVPQQGRPMSPSSASPVSGPASPSSMRGPSSPQAPSQQQLRRNSPPGPSRTNPANELQPPKRVPTILRSGSPAPSPAPLPTRKPVPGQAL
ncbi:MAG: hypothetical protein M1829_000818 [Trizodia sp. TS-e1964]|nr:MAG: hypothetical protein M1829_000818 [Trizodia sp. TS-e1964]